MAKVSVIIPTYNRAHVICRAIDSVLAQTYPDYEIIVVDDGSTDQTAHVLSFYTDRIRYIYQANGGVSKARNTGIKAAAGEYICFLDSDDAFLPNKLELQVGYLDNHPEIDVVLGGWQIIDDASGEIEMQITQLPAAEILKAILLTNIHGLFPPLVALSRAPHLFQVGLFDEALPMHEEQDLWLRLALEGCRFGMVEQTVCNYYDSSDSLGKNLDRIEKVIQVIYQKVFSHPNLPPQIEAMKVEITARPFLELCLHKLRNISSPRERATIVRQYLSKAFAHTVSIAGWQNDLLEPILYVMIDIHQKDSEIGFASILPDINPNLRDTILSRLYVILAFQAYAIDQYKEVIQSVWKALHYNRRVFRDRGVLSIFVHSLFHLPSRTMVKA
ncbi:MAG: glycosyltransferase family A protein [Anaerolineaceae bacterium]|nr:glycosyltransferase family A protein [Anaerolineaceae bacterium]